MGAKRAAKRCKLTPFVKVVNYQHLMPTRYSINAGLNKEVVSKANLKDAGSKAKARKEVKTAFEA
eukprot:UC1_evm1s528